MTEELAKYAFSQGPWAVGCIFGALFLSYLSFRVGRFFQPLVLDFFKSHAEFLVTIRDMGMKLVEQQSQQTALMSRQGDQITAHSGLLADHSEKLDEHGRKIDEIHRVVIDSSGKHQSEKDGR